MLFTEVCQEARILEEEAMGGPEEMVSCTVTWGVPLCRPTWTPGRTRYVLNY
ncbi:UNVERIFIED_CONTAM: hypothetical protein FKN15_046631 [Acipenser sinensis]